jgi:hypothetical protein
MQNDKNRNILIVGLSLSLMAVFYLLYKKKNVVAPIGVNLPNTNNPLITTSVVNSNPYNYPIGYNEGDYVRSKTAPKFAGLKNLFVYQLKEGKLIRVSNFDEKKYGQPKELTDELAKRIEGLQP